MSTAAIVLAGGRSSRMGQPKADLEWHGSTLLRRAVGLARRAVDGPVVVVRAADQVLNPLPADVEFATDAREARGPLEGLAAGLRAIDGRAELAFVCGVDTPMLHPALIAFVLRAVTDDDVALPQAHGHAHPLAAAYRVATVAAALDAVLREDRLGTRALLERLRVRVLDEAVLLANRGLAARDPELLSLENLNAPEQYATARARPAPEVEVVGRGTIRAATLAAAGGGPATINGRPADDPEEPLVAGDVVRLLAAPA